MKYRLIYVITVSTKFAPLCIPLLNRIFISDK